VQLLNVILNPHEKCAFLQNLNHQNKPDSVQIKHEIDKKKDSKMNISWLCPTFTLHELPIIVFILRPFTPEPHEQLQPWTIGAAGE
jgi:hypothetical protein